MPKNASLTTVAARNITVICRNSDEVVNVFSVDKRVKRWRWPSIDVASPSWDAGFPIHDGLVYVLANSEREAPPHGHDTQTWNYDLRVGNRLAQHRTDIHLAGFERQKSEQVSA
eukprot:5116224-Heterocapsa_arctica.AAC.1